MGGAEGGVDALALLTVRWSVGAEEGSLSDVRLQVHRRGRPEGLSRVSEWKAHSARRTFCDVDVGVVMLDHGGGRGVDGG